MKEMRTFLRSMKSNKSIVATMPKYILPKACLFFCSFLFVFFSFFKCLFWLHFELKPKKTYYCTIEPIEKWMYRIPSIFISWYFLLMLQFHVNLIFLLLLSMQSRHHGSTHEKRLLIRVFPIEKNYFFLSLEFYFFFLFHSTIKFHTVSGYRNENIVSVLNLHTHRLQSPYHFIENGVWAIKTISNNCFAIILLLYMWGWQFGQILSIR